MSLQIDLKLAYSQVSTSRLEMQVKTNKDGMPFLVNSSKQDRYKTGTSEKKGQGALVITRRKQDKNDATTSESHMSAWFRSMATSGSSTKSKVSSTKSKTSPTSRTEPKASSTESTESTASSTESSMPCVETQILVMIIYFISRSLEIVMIQELLRRRFGETIDLTIYDKALLIIKDEKLHDGNAYVLNLVDQWLNTQTSYENLESLTFWDDWIEQTLKRVEGRNIDGIEDKAIGRIRAAEPKPPQVQA